MKRIVGTLVALVILSIASQAGAETGLAGRWHFNEGRGTVANDSSGRNDDGTLQGGAAWANGRFGPGLSFNGNGASVHVPNAAALEPASVSVTAWVKRSGSPGAFKYIVAKGASGCIAASYGLYSGRDGGLIFYVSNGGVDFTLSPDAGTGVWDGNWHHVAGSYDGSSVRLYVDGSQVGTGTPTSNPIGYGLSTTNNLVVGSYPGCSGLDFDGAIDEVKVWSRALSPAEVRADRYYAFNFLLTLLDRLLYGNGVRAGTPVTLRFSLEGNLGLGVLAGGGPRVRQVSCSSGTPVDAGDQPASTDGGLQYDTASGLYSLAWKSSAAWAGTCRQLDIVLDDGTTHSSVYRFK